MDFFCEFCALACLTGLYFGIVTSSTIGYGGQEVPQSAGGKLFASIFLLFGVISFTVFAGNLSDRVLSTIMSLIHSRMKLKDDKHAGKHRKRARYMLNKMLLDTYNVWPKELSLSALPCFISFESCIFRVCKMNNVCVFVL